MRDGLTKRGTLAATAVRILFGQEREMGMMRSGRDRQIVNIDDHDECLYWTGQFGVDADQLKEAISAVGHRADDIRDYVERNFVVEVRWHTAD
jgi:hypothetical protein